MGYRFADMPPKPEDRLKRFPVRNGAVARITFGCYYLKGHNPKMHDHLGWPAPDRPDRICQAQSNMRLYRQVEKTVNLDKIHLVEEGYTKIDVAYEDEELADNLITNAWIDEEEDNLVRMTVRAAFPTFEDKPKDLRFTIFVANEGEGLVDAVCHGIITVLPGAVPDFE